MVDTGKGTMPIGAFRMLQMFFALQIEVNTGLRHSRGSVMKLAKREFGCQRATKKGVMEELRTKLKDEYDIEVSTR